MYENQIQTYTIWLRKNRRPFSCSSIFFVCFFVWICMRIKCSAKHRSIRIYTSTTQHSFKRCSTVTSINSVGALQHAALYVPKVTFWLYIYNIYFRYACVLLVRAILSVSLYFCQCRTLGIYVCIVCVAIALHVTVVRTVRHA